MAINPGAGATDLVGRRAGVLNGTNRRANKAGIGLQAASNTSIGAGFTGSPMRTSDGAGSGDFTYLVIASPAASGTREFFACCQSGVEEFYFGANFNVGLGAAAGSLSAQTNVGAASGLVATGSVDGSPHVYVYTRKVNGSACDAVLYSDGIQVAAGGVLKVQMWRSTSADYVAGYNATGWGSSGPTSLVLGWNRALSADEVAEISRNPWQLFEAPDDWDDIVAGAVASLVAEATTAADASGCVLRSVAATAEACGVSDEVMVSAKYTGQAQEVGTAGDSTWVVAAALIASASEAGAAADVGGWGVGNSAVVVSESAGALDASAAVTKMVAACIDTVTASDSVASLLLAMASGVESAGAVDITSAIRAGEVAFARAPTGSGYQPRRNEAQERPQSGPESRPAAIQRIFR